VVAVNGGDGDNIFVAAGADQRQDMAPVVQSWAFQCVTGRVVSCVSQTLKDTGRFGNLLRRYPSTQG
jgi:hypothetical protein